MSPAAGVPELPALDASDITLAIVASTWHDDDLRCAARGSEKDGR